MIVFGIILIAAGLAFSVLIGFANMMSDNPEAKTSQRWPIIILLIGAALLLIRFAQAAPPPHSDPGLAPWFKSLTQPGSGIGCCDLSDCRTVKARVAVAGWEVLINPNDFPVDEAKWIAVPPDKILRGKTNPTGEPVACYTPALGILCFVEPAGA